MALRALPALLFRVTPSLLSRRLGLRGELALEELLPLLGPLGNLLAIPGWVVAGPVPILAEDGEQVRGGQLANLDAAVLQVREQRLVRLDLLEVLLGNAVEQ